MLFALSMLATQQPALQWEEREMSLGEGTVLARRTTLEVPELHGEKHGDGIHLPIVVLPGKEGAGSTPVVFLHGGPGGSALGGLNSDSMQRMFDSMREVGDVVLFDQRGGGQARPSLIVPGAPSLPEDVLMSKANFDAWTAHAFAAALEKAKSQHDLRAYNTIQNAHDVDAIRRALGAEKVHLLAFSYGTHLAQAVLRYHPDAVERAALYGTEGLDMTWKLPETYDAQVIRLTNLIAEDEDCGMPNFYESLRQAVRKLDREPLVASVDGKEYRIGGYGLLWLMRFDIGDTSDLPNFPRLVQAALDGEVEPLMPYLLKRYRPISMGIPVGTFVIDVASGVSERRRDTIERQVPHSFMAPVTNQFMDAVASQLEEYVLPDSFREPVESDVPTIFFSGTLDSNTPPEQAESVRRGFTTSRHVVVRNGGHEDYTWTPEVWRLTVAWLKGEDVEQSEIALPPPDFLPVKR